MVNIADSTNSKQRVDRLHRLQLYDSHGEHDNIPVITETVMFCMCRQELWHVAHTDGLTTRLLSHGSTTTGPEPA